MSKITVDLKRFGIGPEDGEQLLSAYEAQSAIIEAVAAEKQRQAARIKELEAENAELKRLVSDVKSDLLDRAESDSNGCRVVSIGRSIWLRIKDACN